MPVDTTTSNAAVPSFADHKCPHCQKVFPKRPWLDHHKRTCGQQNPQNTAATGSHSTSKSSVIQFYTCSKCPLICKSYIGYRHHMIKKHQEVLSRSVDDCAIKSVKASRQQADATSRLTPSVEAPKSDTAGQHEERAPSDTIVQRVDPSTSFNVSKSKAGTLLEAERNKVLLKQVSPSRCLDFSKSKITRSPQGGAKSPKKRVSCPFCYKSNHKYKSLWHLERHMSTKHKRTVPSPSLTHDHLYCAPPGGIQTSKLTGEKTPSLSTIDKLEGGMSAEVASVPETSVSPNGSSQSTVENETVGLPPLQPCIQTSPSSVSERSEDDASSPLQQIATLSLEMTPVTSVLPNISSQSTLENDAALLPPLQPCIQPSPHRSTSSVSATSQDFVSPPYRPISTPSCKTTPASGSSADPATALKCPLCIDGSNVFNDSHELSVHCLSMHSPQVLLKNCRPEDAKQACSPKSLKLYLWKCAKCCEDGRDKIFRSYEDFNKHISCHHGKVHPKRATSQSHVGEVFKAGMTQPPGELKGVSTNGYSTFQVRVSLAKDGESDGDKVSADVLPERKQNAKSVTDHDDDDDTVPFKSAIAPFLAAVRSELSFMADTHSKSDSVQDNRQQRCHPTKVSHEKSASRPQVAMKKIKAKARVKECISKHLELGKGISDHNSVHLPGSLPNSRMNKASHPSQVFTDVHPQDTHDTVMSNRDAKAAVPFKSAISPFLAAVRSELSSMSDFHRKSDSAQGDTHPSLDRSTSTNIAANEKTSAVTDNEMQASMSDSAVGSELSSLSDFQSETKSSQDDSQERIKEGVVKGKLEEFVEDLMETNNGATDAVLQSQHAMPSSYRDDDDAETIPYMSDVRSELSSLSDFQSETESTQDDSQEKSQWADGVVKNRMEEGVEDKVDTFKGHRMVDSAKTKQKGDDSSLKKTKEVLKVDRFKRDANEEDENGDGEKSGINDKEFGSGETDERPPVLDVMMRMLADIGGNDGCDDIEKVLDVAEKSKTDIDMEVLPVGENVEVEEDCSGRESLVPQSANLENDLFISDDGSDMEQGSDSEMETEQASGNTNIASNLESSIKNKTGVNRSDVLQVSEATDPTNGEKDSENATAEDAEVNELTDDLHQSAEASDLSKDQFLCDDMEQDFNKEMTKSESLPVIVQSLEAPNLINDLYVTDDGIVERAYDNIMEAKSTEKPKSDRSSSKTNVVEDLDNGIKEGGEMKSESLADLGQLQTPHMMNDLFLSDGSLRHIPDGSTIDEASDMPRSGTSPSQTSTAEDLENVTKKDKQVKSSQVEDIVGDVSASQHIVDSKIKKANVMPQNKPCEEMLSTVVSRVDPSKDGTSSCSAKENKSSTLDRNAVDSVNLIVNSTSQSIDLLKLSNGNQPPCTPPKGKTRATHYTFQENSFKDQLAMIQESPMSSGFKCRICKLKFTKDVLPLVHMRSHVQKHKYQRSLCTFKSSFKSAMLRHLQSMHKISHPQGVKKMAVFSGREDDKGEEEACGSGVTKRSLCKEEDESGKTKQQKISNLDGSPSSSAGSWCDREKALLKSISSDDSVDSIIREEEVCGSDLTKRKLVEDENQKRKQKISNLEGSPSSSAESWCDREKALLKSISSDNSVDFAKFTPLTNSRPAKSKRKDHTPKRVDVNLEMEDWEGEDKDVRFESCRRRLCSDDEDDAGSDLVMDICDPTNEQGVEGSRTLEPSGDKNQEDRINVPGSTSITHPRTPREGSSSEQVVEESRTPEPSGGKNHEDGINVPGAASRTHAGNPREDLLLEQVTFQGMPEEHCRAGDGRVSQSQESNMETINSTMPSKELPTRTPRFGDIIVGLCIQTHLCTFMPSIEAQKILLEVCDPRLRLPRSCDKPACWEKRTTYRSFQSLFQHVINHVGETPYCCKTCNYQTRSLTFMNNHMKAVHKCDPMSNAWELPSIDYLNGLPSKWYPVQWYPVQGNNNGIHTSPGGERPIEQTNIAERLVRDDPETARHRKKYVQKVDYIYSPSVAEKSLYSSMKSLFPSANPDVMQILCRFCRKPYSIRDIFLHQRRDHDKMKPFSCCQCEFTCDILADMIAHVKTHQTLGASDVFHICNWQDRRYHQIYTKPSHSSLTDSQVYHCNACKYTTFKLPEMHQHVLANHRVILGLERDPMNGQYLCYVCKQLWADLKAAVKHKCKMVPIVIEQRTNQRLTTSVEKRSSDLSCKLCSFIATTAAALRVHNIVVHEQAQPSSHQLPSAHVDQVVTENGQGFSTSQPRQVQSSDGQVVPVRIQKTPSDNEGMTSWPAVYQLNQLQEQARQDSADRLQSPDGIHSSSSQSQNDVVPNNLDVAQSLRMERDQQSCDNLTARPGNDLPSDTNQHNQVVQSNAAPQVQPARRCELADLLFSPSPTVRPPNQTSHQQVSIRQPALNQPTVSPAATQSFNIQWSPNGGYVQTSRQDNGQQRSSRSTGEDRPSSGQQGHPAVAYLGYVGQLSQSNVMESERQVQSNNMLSQPWNGLPPQNSGAPNRLQYRNGRWVRGRSLSAPHEDMQSFPSWIGPQSQSNSTDQAPQSQTGGMQSSYRSLYPQGQVASGYLPSNMISHPQWNTYAPARYHPYMMPTRYHPGPDHLPPRPSNTMQQVHPYMTGVRTGNWRARGPFPNVQVHSGANQYLYTDLRLQQPQTLVTDSGQRCQQPQTVPQSKMGQQVNSAANQRLCPDQRSQQHQTLQHNKPDQQVNSAANQRPSADKRLPQSKTFQQEKLVQEINSGAKQGLCPDQRNQQPQTLQQDQTHCSHYLPLPDYWTVARRPGGHHVAVPSGSSGRPVQGTRIPPNLQRFMNPSAPTPPPPMSSTQMDNILNNALRTAAQRLRGGMKQTMVTDPKSAPLMEENHASFASLDTACHVANRQETLPVSPESVRFQTSPAQVSSAAVINSETARKGLPGEGKTGNSETARKDLPGEGKTNNSETARKDLPGEGKRSASESDINIGVPDMSDEDFLEWMLHSPIPDEPGVNLPEEPDTDKDSSPTLSLNTSHSEDIPVLNDKDAHDQGASAAEATMPSMEERMASTENTSSGKPDSDNDEQVQSETTPMVTRVVNMKNGYMKKVGFGRPC